MTTNHPIYWLSYHGPDGRPTGRRTLSDKIPDDAQNNTMAGDAIGLAICYDGIKKIGHLAVPDGVQHRIVDDTIEITKQSALDGTKTTWVYGIDDLIREGVAFSSGTGAGKPYIVTLR